MTKGTVPKIPRQATDQEGKYLQHTSQVKINIECIYQDLLQVSKKR